MPAPILHRVGAGHPTCVNQPVHVNQRINPRSVNFSLLLASEKGNVVSDMGFPPG